MAAGEEAPVVVVEVASAALAAAALVVAAQAEAGNFADGWRGFASVLNKMIILV